MQKFIALGVAIAALNGIYIIKRRCIMNDCSDLPKPCYFYSKVGDTSFTLKFFLQLENKRKYIGFF